ncbi:MAG: chorismate--pyruvate lyase [Gammaproteobacteria bacterium]|nr:chorismate--pyruvate lyase [Gammaproteobacteria bacterium]
MKKTIKPTWEKLSVWQKRAIKLPWQAWLLHGGSFMQRLVQHGVADTRIKILSEGWQRPKQEESVLLRTDPPIRVFVREVLICNEQQSWMFARTVIPREMLTGEEEALAHLKERSLGSVLFKNPALKRSEFEVACLKPHMFLHSKAVSAVEESLPDLWARRSVFSLPGKSLLLTEVFLPNMMLFNEET